MGGYMSRTEPDTNRRAVAIIKGDPVQGTAVSGAVWFLQEREGAELKIAGEIGGLKPGQHGFHVHQYGDMSDGCTSAGPHLNPYNMMHGGPKDSVRHMGDLGNVEAGSNGVAKIDMTDKQLSLYGQHSIIGRSIVVHADPDDLGKATGNKMAESKETGNSGMRVGCGIIAVASSN
uniref:Superoxide dismutase [Cu-Zn] n=1 Tax=Plectus sambesii TaxID=2011161 RepID=A0A914W312_9BILA